jgi:hypothetical protein
VTFVTELQELLEAYGVPHAGAIRQIHYNADGPDWDSVYVETANLDEESDLTFVDTKIKSRQERGDFERESTPIYDDTIYYWDGRGDASIRKRFGHVHSSNGLCIKRRNYERCEFVRAPGWQPEVGAA